MIEITQENTVLGATYSQSNYEDFKENKNIFEEVIDALMLDQYSDEPELTEFIKTLPGDKKRLAILSLLDKDNNMWLKLKSMLGTTSLSKVAQIKDVVLMLREYVKIAEVEKKKFGEVMTPLDLVKEMLAVLPVEVWSNPNLKWLDPANGTGPYPIMVIYKLMKGLEKWQPDEELRYKHIIENMIYVCELQPKNMFLYLCAIDPKDEYNCNVYTGSFLEKEFDKHMKEIWNVDKFDVVIGNPPYNNGTKSVSEALWIKFIKKSVNFSKFILLITPKTWCNLNSNSFDKDLYNIFKNYVKYVNITDSIVEKYFKGVGSTFSYYLLDIDKNDYIFELESNDGKYTLEYDKIKFIPQIFNKITLSILNKTLWSDSKKIEGVFKEQTGFRKGGKYINEDNYGIYKVSNTSAQYSKSIWLYSDRRQDTLNKPKVIFSDSGYNKPYYDSGLINLGHHSRAFFIKDENDANNLIKFLNGNLVKFLSKLMVPTGSCVGFERFASLLPYNYNEIELTTDELEFISKNV